MGNTVLWTNTAQEPNAQFKPPSAAHLVFPLRGLVTVCETLVSPVAGNQPNPNINPKTQQFSRSFRELSGRDWQHNTSSSSWLVHCAFWLPVHWDEGVTWDLMALHWTAHVLCASLSCPSHLSWKNSANSCLLITAQRERREILWETPCIPTVKTNKALYLYIVLPCLSKRNSVKQPDRVRNVPAYGRRVGLDDF